MPKVAKELTPMAVKQLRHPGPPRTSNVVMPVGGVSGLLIQITPSNAKSWIVRTMVGTKRREIGLGSYPEISLGQARIDATDEKRKIKAGIDPVAERKENRLKIIAQQKRGLTFKAATERYLSNNKIESFRNEKHKRQWRSTLEQYANTAIGDMLVSDIGVDDIKRTLAPIWNEKRETARRLRGRIEHVLRFATDEGYRTGDNPASPMALKTWIDNQGGQVKDNHPALALKDASDWFKSLRDREGTAARALEFATLTAARSGEVRGMTWDEIDRDAKTWTIPASRMKAKREHIVPLTDAAVAIIDAMPKMEGSDFVFAAPRGGALSDMSLSAVMRRMQESEEKAGRKGWLDPRSGRAAVPHGLRSTFRDWTAEKTDYPHEMAETALAHFISNKVEAAYRRGTMIEKRRAMMEDWSKYLIDAK